ncbi:hypothetical protein [Frankia sp. R82]|uniref:hypothetical protein n=1 Tax=Frankia sp. R82 TaxID=2950553 RepID=UPI0020431701|nr:hypothetical protein [Frankia sp. R82]MCM3886704.1 hypothetical protein [Frankia sp. R82]
MLADEAFQHAVASLVYEVRPHDPGAPLTLADPGAEPRLCGLAWWMGVFDRSGRRGYVPTVPRSAREAVEGLLGLIVPIGLDDVVGLVRAAGNGPFARLRGRVDAPVVAGAPCRVGAGGDVLVGRTLLTLWTTVDLASLTTPSEAMPLLCLLVGGLLVTDAEVRHVAVYLTRQRWESVGPSTDSWTSAPDRLRAAPSTSTGTRSPRPPPRD